MKYYYIIIIYTYNKYVIKYYTYTNNILYIYIYNTQLTLVTLLKIISCFKIFALTRIFVHFLKVFNVS